MTSPIDLDLVELRCRLRGWTCERFVEDSADYASIECKYGGELVLGADGFIHREYGWNTPAHKRIEDMLLVPRWTLDRLMSSPSDGWSCIGVQLVWGDVVGDTERHEVVASVQRWDGKFGLDVSVFGDAGPDDLARFSERLKATAELALIVAEIEPC